MSEMEHGKIRKAAGIIYVDPEGHILLLKRGEKGDHPGTWAFPAGGIEDDEKPLDAAIRESKEEVSHIPIIEPKLFHEDDSFSTFMSPSEQFEAILNDEHTEYKWAKPGELPEPLHPGVRILADKLSTLGLTELDVARLIRAGSLASPQQYENMWLFDMRITGTETAYRKKLDEYVYRPPEDYMNQEFLDRCNGLPVIFEHPASNILNSQEFSDRIIGTIMLPYLRESEQEVWGIARIYDADAAEIMTKKQMSTSPAVLFRDPEVNSTADLDNGSKILIEGKPSLLDHLAICEQGVWDKDGPAVGVVSVEAKSEDSMADANVKADDAKADAAPEWLDKVMSGIDSIAKRMDSMEAKHKADDDAKKKADDDDDEGHHEGKGLTVADKKARKDDDAMLDAKKKARKDDDDDDDDDDDAKKKADAEEHEAKAKEAEAAKLKAEAKEEELKADDDEEKREMEIADAQTKADSLASAFGDSAPMPRAGETALAYRRRVAMKYQKHSAVYKDIPLTKIADAQLFEIAEKQIYTDAMTAAHSPINVPEGSLMPVITRDQTGRQVTSFRGQPSVWMNQFRSPRRYLRAINKGN